MSAPLSPRLILLACLPLLSGCALLTKAEPIEPVYFSPEPDEPRAKTTPTGRLLQLRRVEAADHLGERLVVRTADGAYALDELHRWTQPPGDYVRRALASELFERRGFVRAIGGSAPELEVDLALFEDRRKPSAAVIRVAIRLLKDDRALLEETIRVQVPVPGELDDEGRPAKLARAMGEALQQTVDRIGEAVTKALAGLKNQAKPS